MRRGEYGEKGERDVTDLLVYANAQMLEGNGAFFFLVFIVFGERSEFCVTLKILQRHHIIQPPFKINESVQNSVSR